MSSCTQVPLKWIKYLMLAQFGFVSREELEEDIRRYKRSDRRQVIRDIEADIRTEKDGGRGNLYVIKLVSVGLPGRLPNFRVEGLSDLPRAAQFLADYDGYNHAEIWFCRTRIDDRVFSVAGRFVFTPDDSARVQLVEQVWRCSPRLLEGISTGRARFPYLRASRYSWGWPYTVLDTRIPKGSGVSRRDLLDEFHRSMCLFERQRELIEPFLTFLESFSLHAYSLEYKIVGSKMSIIDWDTPDDRVVVTGRERLGAV